MGLAFILELVAFAGFATISLSFPMPQMLQIILGIVLLAGLIVFWSLFMAPRAKKKFDSVIYYLAKFIIYTIAALSIYKFWGHTYGLIFVALSSVDEAILFRHNTRA